MIAFVRSLDPWIQYALTWYAVGLLAMGAVNTVSCLSTNEGTVDLDDVVMSFLFAAMGPIAWLVFFSLYGKDLSAIMQRVVLLDRSRKWTDDR